MKKTSPLQDWRPADCFAIPLCDGTSLLGQILAAEPMALNSVSCALFDQLVDQPQWPEPDLRRLFSTVLTSRDLLDVGEWKILGSHPIRVPREAFPFEALRASDFVGAKVVGSSNVAELANAFRGLVAWDNWADPLYLDGLLLSPEVKPKNLLYKGR